MKLKLEISGKINLAYKNFIKQQNDFLNSIIYPYNNKKNQENKNAILYFYFDTLKKRINIQDSKNNHKVPADILLETCAARCTNITVGSGIRPWPARLQVIL